MSKRDDFSENVKRKLAARAGYVCSNPKCKQPTSGPSQTDKLITNVGVAAHITAATKRGPRFNPNLKQEQRSSIENGIWLCQKCSKAIDDDSDTYTVMLLNDWKTNRENEARLAIEGGINNGLLFIKINVLVHKAYFIGDPVQYYFIKIVNLSKENDVEITHVWYESTNGSVEILSRKLPARLKPAQTYETWIPVHKIPKDENIFNNFRVILSTEEVFASKMNKTVRPSGFIAGI